jgi:TetR/AcrR family transcriptional repressor of mexJK operon
MRNDAAMEPGEAVSAKGRQILVGARQVFGELGFERASVDLIAARAGVSKATVYHHFVDKKALFIAAVAQECDDMRVGLERCCEQRAGDVEQALQALGEKLIALALSPAVSGLYRQVIAEAVRLPEIGRLVLERGTLAAQDAVASHLRVWHERGALRIDDVPSAAIAFVALCQGDLAVRSRLGVLTHPFDDQVRVTVQRAVRIFVRAYAP